MLIMKGKVFSIEEFSTFDGPGIRTTAFLMGCPLRCQWCHNPEGQAFDNCVLRSPNGCVQCGNCVRAATVIKERVVLNNDSILACPNRLLRWCATEYTPEGLAAKLMKNVTILNASGGGVTFSGGEPLAQPDFLIACLQQLDGKLDRAIQTSGFAPAEVFERALNHADRFLFDIKLMDEQLHKHYTGVSNIPIMNNFMQLVKSGKPFVVRTPLIPGVTDTDSNLKAIAEFLRNYGVNYIELLPYNQMAGSKYALVGRVYKPEFDEKIAINENFGIFYDAGIDAVLI